jgi:hypothetical protein
MTKILEPVSEYARWYAGPVLRRRIDALRASAAQGDRGASAIELAIITALIAAAAAFIATIIVVVIHSKASIIQGL